MNRKNYCFSAASSKTERPRVVIKKKNELNEHYTGGGAALFTGSSSFRNTFSRREATTWKAMQPLAARGTIRSGRRAGHVQQALFLEHSLLGAQTVYAVLWARPFSSLSSPAAPARGRMKVGHHQLRCAKFRHSFIFWPSEFCDGFYEIGSDGVGERGSIS